MSKSDKNRRLEPPHLTGATMAPSFSLTSVEDRVANPCGETHLGERFRAVKYFFADRAKFLEKVAAFLSVSEGRSPWRPRSSDYRPPGGSDRSREINGRICRRESVPVFDSHFAPESLAESAATPPFCDLATTRRGTGY